MSFIVVDDGSAELAISEMKPIFSEKPKLVLEWEFYKEICSLRQLDRTVG